MENNFCYLIVQNTKMHLTDVQGNISLINLLSETPVDLDTNEFTQYELVAQHDDTIQSSHAMYENGYFNFLVDKDFNEFEKLDPNIKIFFIENQILYTKIIPENIKQQIIIKERKTQIKQLATDYAKSPAVDDCIISGKNILFNGNLRGKIANRLDNEQAAGNTDVTLIFAGNEYRNAIAVFQQMLLQINLRADRNFDNYQRHLKNINTLNTEEELRNYDYKTDYEPPLTLM